MTAPGGDDLSKAKDGPQRFLNYWLYGVVKSAADLGYEKVFLRRAGEEAVGKMIEVEGIRPPGDLDPLGILRAYLGALGGDDLTSPSDVAAHADGERLHVEIGSRCPCRPACEWMQSEGMPVVCIQATAIAGALRQMGQHDFKCALDSIGVPCRVTMAPVRFEVR